VTAPESADQSAMHVQTGPEERHAQTWRAHTRDSVHDDRSNVIDLTERSRQRIAERWGKKIEEPPQDASTDPDNEPPKAKDALNQMHLWRDPSPSLRAVWNDLQDGGGAARDDGGLLLAAGYWVLGIPGFGLVVIAKVTETVGARPGRVFGALIVALLTFGALLIAGINPL
jgi:hypothetical protein